MTEQPHCPACKASLAAPRERVMPDRVVEYRCPACTYQIPLLPPGSRPAEVCPECGADLAAVAAISGVDSTGLVNFHFCGSCGCLLGRSWGILGL